MKRMHVSAAKRLLGVLLLSVLTGCPSEKPDCPVSGRLVEDGKPVSASTERLPPGTQPIRMAFHALPRDGGAPGESFFCAVDPGTGEFTVKGPSNKGIPPGRYRISVAALSASPAGAPRGGDPAGMGGAPDPTGMMGMSDKLKGAYSREKSRLEVDITGPTQLVIDVGSKPGVSAQ